MTKREVFCKICEKSIHRIFLEHIEAHLREIEEEKNEHLLQVIKGFADGLSKDKTKGSEIKNG